MQFGKFQQILKSFEISVNISSVGEGLCFACSAVHMAQGVPVVRSIWHRCACSAVHMAQSVPVVQSIWHRCACSAVHMAQGVPVVRSIWHRMCL